MGSYSTALDCGDYLTDSQFTKFDITELVKGWKNNTYSAQAGFILINDDETAYKQMFSCEHTATNCRPYVTMEYRTDFFLDKMTASVLEGGTVTITASSTPSGQPVTWSTSNSAVATVSASGVVTAKKAGTVTITATLTDTDETTKTASCTVYVRIADGVYFLKNQYSSYYMTVTNGRISSGSDVCQYYKAADSADVIYRIRQMWRIHYLGNGRYSIRPMHKLDMGLDVIGGNVCIYKIGTTDTLSGVADYAEWTIEWGTIGYIFKQRGDSTKTAQIENASQSVNAAVVASDYSSSYSCQWVATKIASPPSGVYLYDTVNHCSILSATKYVAPEENRSLSTQSLAMIAYDGTVISQTFTWTRSSASYISVSSYGTVTGKSPGSTTVTASKTLNGVTYSRSYTVNTTLLANGTYFVSNKATGKYADIEDQAMADGTQIHQWTLHGGNSQRWTFTHLGDGYYSIKSANSTGSYYMGVSGDSTANNAAVVLRTGSITNGMKWKVSLASSGAYILTPKTGEANSRVLAVGTYLASTDGIDIEQRDYVNDTNYKDEWSVGKIDRAILLGFRELPETTPRNGYFSDTLGYLQRVINNRRSLVDTNYYSHLSVSEMIDYLESNDIFFIHTHGHQTGIAIGQKPSEEESFLTLEMDDLDDVNLTNLQFALLVACNTAKTEEGNSNNITKKLVDCGVETAVGFSEFIYSAPADTFLVEMAKLMTEEGLTVSQAINEILEHGYSIVAQYAVIEGNRDLLLRP